MINKTEADEQEYLPKIIDKLEDAYTTIDENVNRTSKELKEQKNYLYENKTGMDAAEKPRSSRLKRCINILPIKEPGFAKPPLTKPKIRFCMIGWLFGNDTGLIFFINYINC